MKQQDGYMLHGDDYTDWHSLDREKWTEAHKALWILEHGVPEFAWIYERVDNTVYRRPVMGDTKKPVPPWLNPDREIVKELKSNTFIESMKEMAKSISKKEKK